MLPDRRVFFHVDMDAFFVSVEELYDPSLVGKVVVVGGHRDERGVVAAASYAARKYGVHSAMPLRTASKLLPNDAVFVEGHPDRYRDCSRKVREVLSSFTPALEMASIDEAYLDMTGTERLHGPPLKAAHALHAAMLERTRLKCSIGISAARMVAKVASDQAKRNGVLYVLPGCESAFLAPLDVRKIPGVGKVTEQNLHALGIRKVGDLARLDDDFLEERFGKWGLALAGKSRGQDAGGWFDNEIGSDDDPKSISHEHTFNTDTAEAPQIEATLARLSEMVARRLREARLFAHTVQLKLRYSDFTTITRAHTLSTATQLDTEILVPIRELWRKNWDARRAVRLLGVQVSSLEREEGQMGLLDSRRHERWKDALSAADKLRDKFGEGAVSLASGMSGNFRERTHDAMPERPEPRDPRRDSRVEAGSGTVDRPDQKQKAQGKKP
jgi:DNA polymerase IV